MRIIITIKKKCKNVQGETNEAENVARNDKEKSRVDEFADRQR